MIKYQLFPRSLGVSSQLNNVVNCFESVYKEISSEEHTLNSNDVLEILRFPLEGLDFLVEKGKAKHEKINVPVLYGHNNQIDKSFNADALSRDGKIVIEVEAGRAVANNQFLKDIFQACMMIEIEFLVVAVRNDYRGSDDFIKVFTFLETLFVSNRLKLPLKGILLIGY